MQVYKCLISGDEVLCDNNRVLQVEDDVVFVVKGKWIDVGGEDYGISSNVDDEAAEGTTAEGGAEAKAKVIDVVNQNRLSETSFDKKSYMAYMKGYMKTLKTKIEEGPNKDRAAAFMAGAQVFVKKVLAEFDEFQFFVGESGSDEGIIVLAKWVGEEALFYFWKDGLKGEKV